MPKTSQLTDMTSSSFFLDIAVFLLSSLVIGRSFMSKEGLIQKEKVHIDREKGAQISILANKSATQ